MAVFWDRELRFWDVRVYFKKNDFHQLNIEKIKKLHIDNAYFIMGLVVLGMLCLFDLLLSTVFYYWLDSQLMEVGADLGPQKWRTWVSWLRMVAEWLM